MKVFYKVRHIMSQAMFRTRRELAERAPADVQFTDRLEDADVQVVDAIGADAIAEAKAPHVVYLQHCYHTAGASIPEWVRAWQRAALVASYYDLPEIAGRDDFPFLRQPLGVSAAFREADVSRPRVLGAVTSGYVSGFGAEAIEDVALAARAVGKHVFHLGPPHVQNMHRPHSDAAWVWTAKQGLTDTELAKVYATAQYVSGLRWTEGFELPAAEGLVCGARPVLFDLPCYRDWYGDMAVYVRHDPSTLRGELEAVLRQDPPPVTPRERQAAMDRFDWHAIARRFWAAVSQRVGAGAAA
jgi:hypothetical protein